MEHVPENKHTVRKENVVPDVTGIQLTDDICSEKGIGNDDSVQSHDVCVEDNFPHLENETVNNQPYECNVCEMWFSQLFLLQKHSQDPQQGVATCLSVMWQEF